MRTFWIQYINFKTYINKKLKVRVTAFIGRRSQPNCCVKLRANEGGVYNTAPPHKTMKHKKWGDCDTRHPSPDRHMMSSCPILVDLLWLCWYLNKQASSVTLFINIQWWNTFSPYTSCSVVYVNATILILVFKITFLWWSFNFITVYIY